MRRRFQRKTVGMRALRKGANARGKKRSPKHWRPERRADCEAAARPCPFVGCRYHLALDATRSGGLRSCSPDEIVEMLKAMPYTCAIDAAEDQPKGMTHTDIGACLGLTRERVRQVNDSALRKLERAVRAIGIEPHIDFHNVESNLESAGLRVFTCTTDVEP